MGILLLFFDGIGVGRPDPDTNPFARAGLLRLGMLGGGRADVAAFRSVDATLWVEGLPQSATGQTTLYTGVNAAAVLGRHQVGLPGPTLWPLLERESLFRKLVAKGRRPVLTSHIILSSECASLFCVRRGQIVRSANRGSPPRMIRRGPMW